ncbi:MAG TPA: flavoprotein [bacterium]|nr:flavoprotein [bacterium]
MKKNIIIGVCGSIAAYKSCEIVRQLKKKGWTVKVIMTENAANFITPLTLATLSMNAVYSDMFGKDAYESYDENHISLSEFASCILIAPATACIIGKVASGICDDLLTCTVFASRARVVFAPAMNDKMWNNPIVQDNVSRLKKYGYIFVEPEEGELASGKKGTGRLASIDKIMAEVERKT